MIPQFLITSCFWIGCCASLLLHGQIPYYHNCKMAIQAAAKTNALAADQRPVANSNNYDLKYERIALQLDPDTAVVAGQITFVFQIKVPITSFLEFDMDSNLKVSAVWFHRQRIKFQAGPSVIRLQLPLPLYRDELDSVTIEYAGRPTATGFGSFKTRAHETGKVLWTLSQPYGARDWMPCKQTLTDKIDSIDIFITHPADQVAVANGIKISETLLANNQKLTHWKHRYPIPTYLIAVAVSNYRLLAFEATLPSGKKIPVQNFLFPQDSAKFTEGCYQTLEFFNLFNQRFIEYPYADEKYGHAQCGFKGGMEHATISFMGDFGYELVAHELAHHWFGNYITCASWQDIWLNEGFATFLSGMCYENTWPSTPWWGIWKKNIRKLITEQPGGSVYVIDTVEHTRVFDPRLTYYKGSAVLHQLRHEIGDEAFFAGIKSYLLDTNLRFGYARTPDLQYHLEKAANTSLDYYFQQWIYKAGHPNYTLSWYQTPEKEVMYRVTQRTSDPGVTFFKQKLPVAFWYKDSSGVAKYLLDIISPAEPITYYQKVLPFEVDSITLDPDYALIMAEPVYQKLDFKIRVYPNPAAAYDIITVDTSDPRKRIKSITLYNYQGSRITTWQPNQPTAYIQLPGITSGNYILDILTNTDRHTEKLIVIE